MQKGKYAKLFRICKIIMVGSISLLGAIENIKIESNSSIEMLVKFFCHDSQLSLDLY